jgi:hypothetical protein
MEGFRYKCTKCPDHDLCEACHAEFLNGKLKHTNKINTVSPKLEEHAFEPFVDPNSFTPLKGASKSAAPVQKKSAKIGVRLIRDNVHSEDVEHNLSVLYFTGE